MTDDWGTRGDGRRKETGDHECGSEDVHLGLGSQAFINQTFIRNIHTVMQPDNLFHYAILADACASARIAGKRRDYAWAVNSLTAIIDPIII